MVARLNVVLAVVARVDELVLTLIVQLVQHTQCAELGSTHRREFKVLLARHCQEGVSSVHEITCHERIRVLDGLQICIKYTNYYVFFISNRFRIH